MRLPNNKINELKKKAFDLEKQQFSNKEIAEKIGVTPKTISKWLKNTNEVKELQAKLLERIKIALEDKETPIKDIFCLFQSLKTCENIQIL